METTIKKLKSSPLFYLFLSSRELFHSNFWLWLSTINKAETIKLFSNKTLSNDINFKREHNQSHGKIKATVDLYIVNHIVIENKIKDFPTEDQLFRIKSAFNNSELEFVLTTLFWTNELSFNGWNVKTYKEIADAIIPGNFTQDAYYASLISDYKQFVLNLAELASQLEINEAYDFAISFQRELFNELNEIKLWEGYQKLRASHLLIHFQKRNIHNVTTKYGINNQKATIDFVFKLNNGYEIGVQLEDNQYRKFVSGKKAGEFAENLIKHNLFLTDTFNGRGNKPYLNYGDGFKYQYVKIENTSFNNLFNEINNDVLYMLNNIKQLESQIPV
jgi:hypothetical protein